MAEKFVGSWKLVDSSNFDDYMKKAGIGMVTRVAASAIKPVLQFEVNGDHWKMTSTSTFTTWVAEFDLGKEYEQATPDGRKMMSTFTFEGGKLVEEQKKIKSGDKDSHFERYIDDTGKLVIECECDGVKAVRKYEKQE